MRKLLELGNVYASNSTWKDFALTKICVAPMGFILGTFVPEEKAKTARIAAGGIFGVSYFLLMSKLISTAKGMRK